MNHDARFKMLLKTPTVLKRFFEASLPEAAGFVGFAAVEFVDKERVTPDGRKRTGDLLVKTRFRGRKRVSSSTWSIRPSGTGTSSVRCWNTH